MNPPSESSPSPVRACSCWLGTGATFGSSVEREACAVHGSPVRASAQEQRLTEIEARLKVDAHGSYRGYFRSEEGHDVDVTAMYSDLRFLLEVARGRQQAEQARDEFTPHMAAGLLMQLKLEAEKQHDRAEALTQALKDYGRHTPKCDRSVEGRDWPCDCGLDAMLIGVQRCS